MSKVKRTVSILIAVVMVVTLSTPLTAHASTRTYVPPSENIWLPPDVIGIPLDPIGPPPGIVEIAPFWQNISSAFVGVSASGRTVMPSMIVWSANGNQQINGTLSVERLSGGSWVRVASWSVSGRGSIQLSRTFNGSAGGTYRARIVVTAGTDRVDRVSPSVRT